MTSTNPQTPPADPEDRRKHLEFIQAVIARLSNSSATAKGWSLTVAAAAFGFSTANDRWYLALLGCVVLAAFSVVDAYYLHSERVFRDFYETARLGNAQPYFMAATTLPTTRRRIQSYRTWSVLGFYGPLFLAGVVVTVVLILGDTDDAASDRTPAHRPDRQGHSLGSDAQRQAWVTERYVRLCR